MVTECGLTDPFAFFFVYIIFYFILVLKPDKYCNFKKLTIGLPFPHNLISERLIYLHNSCHSKVIRQNSRLLKLS